MLNFSVSPAAHRAAVNGPRQVVQIDQHMAEVVKRGDDFVRVGFIGLEGVFREYKGDKALRLAFEFIAEHNRDVSRKAFAVSRMKQVAA